MKWFNKELSSMKMMSSEVLKAVGPKDPTPLEREPSEPSEDNAGPLGQVSVDLVELPSGHLVDAQAEPSWPSVVDPTGPSGPSVEVQPSETLPTGDSILCQGSGPEKESLNPVEPAQQSKIFSMTEAKTEEQWARSNKDLYSQFRRVQVARYPPRESPLPLSEWFQIHHKNRFGPFIQKEIKFIRQYQMYSNYCYVNRLPESQLGQFRAAIRALSSCTAHTESLQVNFATLVIPDVVFLPPLHALIMDSSVGTLIFERAVRVMARLFVQDGRDLSFPRFVFRQYLQGHIKADVLAPILSECERLSPEEWTKLYPLSAQQLGDLNASQASSNQPPLSPGEFLDANSLHLIRDSYLTWVERYKVFFALKKELRSLQIAYPLKIEAFLRFSSFRAFLPYKVALGNTNFISKGWLPPWDPPIKLNLGPFKLTLKSRNARHSLSSGALAPYYPLLITYL
ncbi:hypothetical protein Taro_021327 [Colocasia esculenta]|uniref:Uncharacterized protein n=1 Tax=Colocasia esculenta TaxID=4460 RepID=A0A843V4N8_COLES|nr:hypothetical protein [Colocasia esculenta]